MASEPTEASEATAAGAHRATTRDGQPAPGGRNGSDWLGRGLRRLYQGTVNEPIPDKFRELLSRLDEQVDEQSDASAGPARPPKAEEQP